MFYYLFDFSRCANFSFWTFFFNLVLMFFVLLIWCLYLGSFCFHVYFVRDFCCYLSILTLFMFEAFLVCFPIFVFDVLFFLMFCCVAELSLFLWCRLFEFLFCVHNVIEFLHLLISLDVLSLHFWWIVFLMCFF